MLQSLENRAPLIDAHISRDPQSSLDVLYVCTGQDRYGCVREIRSGVGVEMLSISPSDPEWNGYVQWRFETNVPSLLLISLYHWLHIVLQGCGIYRMTKRTRIPFTLLFHSLWRQGYYPVSYTACLTLVLTIHQGGPNQLKIDTLLHRCRTGNAGCFWNVRTYLW